MPHRLLDQILPILSAVRDDKEKLQRILAFLESEILPEIKNDDDKIKIPKKYEALVRNIGQALQVGMHCFLNMDTLELEEIPGHLLEDMWAYLEDDDEDREKDEDLELKHINWEHVLTFEPLQSSESFRIMEDFAGQINNAKVQNTLIDILNRRKPFAHFNHYIHNSKYREEWFAFKNAAYERHVREQIYIELNKSE